METCNPLLEETEEGDGGGRGGEKKKEWTGGVEMAGDMCGTEEWRKGILRVSDSS